MVEMQVNGQQLENKFTAHVPIPPKENLLHTLKSCGNQQKSGLLTFASINFF